MDVRESQSERPVFGIATGSGGSKVAPQGDREVTPFRTVRGLSIRPRSAAFSGFLIAQSLDDVEGNEHEKPPQSDQHALPPSRPLGCSRRRLPGEALLNESLQAGCRLVQAAQNKQ